MTKAFVFERSERSFGTLEFDENPQVLNARRALMSFDITLPSVVKLNYVASDAPIPLLSNLQCKIHAIDSPNSIILLGRIEDDSWYRGYANDDNQGGASESQTSMHWLGALPDLAYYEKIRASRQPRFQLHFKGELCYLLRTGSRHRIRTEPEQLYCQNSMVEITYPTEVWLQMLRSLNMVENVLVEIPLPATPPAPWDDVWEALVEARNYFERGGTTGWKGCVAATRLALERWQKIEKQDMGPGWKAPTMDERKDRTKKQRFDNLRWHLYQCAHLGAHSAADEWSRDDAVLLLSTLSALLAERKP